MARRPPPPPPPPPPRPPAYGEVVISGMGLLGASLGMALRTRGLAGHVTGVGRDLARLRQAAERGAADASSLDLADACSRADLVVLCGPVSVIQEQLGTAIGSAPAGALVTDVGSTKRSIAQAAARLARAGVDFVGSHPMAGSEKSGAEHARADLYEGATVVLTPDISTSDGALERVRALWEGVGMRAVEVLPARHDQIVARLSHLPHLVASALVAQSDRGRQAPAETLRAIAGPGFRDSTRIAMGNVPMWLDIFLDNRKAMLESLDEMIGILHELRQGLADRDRPGLESFLESASELRAGYERRGK